MLVRICMGRKEVLCWLGISRTSNGEDEHSLEEKPYLRDAYMCQLLSAVDMRRLCELPEGLDKAEWMASHTACLFHHVNLVSGALSDFCTSSTCPAARGPGGV
ncbi:MOB kinase activator 2-like isoform X1 [Arapaima gigas]